MVCALKVHIIPGLPTDDALPVRRDRYGDYAALIRLRRARTVDAPAPDALVEPPVAHGDPADDAAPDHSPEEAPQQAATAHVASAGQRRSDAPAPQVRTQASGPVAAVAPCASTARFMRLAEYLMGRIADFCSDPGVLKRGNWDIQIPIDPALMPGCTLRLGLSHFDLTLRFDTTDAQTKQLISHHCETLKMHLDALLRQYGTSREIQIFTW